MGLGRPMGVADGRFELSLDQPFVVDLDVVVHEEVRHSHLEAAGIDCTGLGLSVAAVPFVYFAAVVAAVVSIAVVVEVEAAVAAVGIAVGEPAFAAAAHTGVVAALIAAVAVAVVSIVVVVEVAAAVAAAVGIAVADDMAVEGGLHMVGVGC